MNGTINLRSPRLGYSLLEKSEDRKLRLTLTANFKIFKFLVMKVTKSKAIMKK